MKKLFYFLIVFSITHFTFAQSEKYQKAFSSFQAHYNEGKYDQIFNTFSTEMKLQLPLETSKQFFAGLKMQVGKIQSAEFLDYHSDTYAKYKTSFEKAVLDVNLSLDDQNNINGLFLVPHEEKLETAPDNGTNVVNALTDYPKEIASMIFSEAKLFPENTQLSIAVIQNGKTNYYGVIKINDTLKTIENQNKVFEIGSLTKVFTATVLASLVEEGRIKLTDEVNAYYKFPFKNKIKINFQNLANHTSGLPRLPENLDLSNEANPYKSYGKREINDYLQNYLALEYKPSTNYSYSNLGAGLLSYTLGLSQKTSFENLLQQKIFDQYHMTNSFTNSENLGDKLVKGQDKKGEFTPNWDFDVLFGAGGILSTTEDLSKFASAQFNPENKELALTRQQTFDINGIMKIGLGWHLTKSESGKEVFWHNGGTGGYSSSLILNVDQKTAVVVLSNVSAFHPAMDNIDRLCFRLIDKVGKVEK